MKRGAVIGRDSGDRRVWTVAEAKARLSEILRLAEDEGPQQIGLQRPCVVVTADAWHANTPPRTPLGQWLLANVPRGTNLQVPRERSSSSGGLLESGAAE